MRRFTHVVAVFAIVSTCAAKADDPPAPPAPLKRVDSRELEELERTIQRLYAKLTPSVVRLNAAEVPGAGTGFIISSEGDVLTCAHMGWPPGTRINAFIDGRDHKATSGGTFRAIKTTDFRYYPHDLAVARLAGRADWPVVELGRAADLKPSTLNLAIGFPHVLEPGQPPLVRLGRVIRLPGPLRVVQTSCRITSGDSGGPLFTLDGRVVGVCSGCSSQRRPEFNYEPIDSFPNFRKRLLAGEHIELKRDPEGLLPESREPFGAVESDDALAKTLSAARSSVVEVLAGKKPLGFGLAAAKGGWIVTKRSEIVGREPLRCRLVDGREFEAKLVGDSQPHDLAVLKCEARDLPVPQWSESKPTVGQFVATVGMAARPLHLAVVGAVLVKNPGIRPVLGIEVAEAKGEAAFKRFFDRGEYDEVRKFVKPGDVITHFNGLATPTRAAVFQVYEEWIKRKENVAGDPVVLTLRRGGETLQVAIPTITEASFPSHLWREQPLSCRRNGFADVFAHDGVVAPAQCGTPVVDRSGHVIGLNIACPNEIQTYALPTSIVREVVEKMQGH